MRLHSLTAARRIQYSRSVDNRHSSLCNCAIRRHEADVINQLLLHFLARNNGVNETAVQEKFRRLESRRQIRLRRVLDHALEFSSLHPSVENRPCASCRQHCHL